ncbi:MAG: A/G-specific adenine glycosylase [Euryarchaeota archaeon RBG_16_68_13]|nr:MAG: A/G-specific adenine glycosylase [Euryarchaeota archaeon RBG_16_68_13]
MEDPRPKDVARRLLAWFDERKRDLPWRRTRDPYRILVAEYLLQRTRVASGTPYYERFLARFPDVATLASASPDEVLKAWEGLGFYRRARNLHAAARTIASRHGGEVPRTAAGLATLPGVGPYTSGAVASIAFGERVPAVDGNAARVLARLFSIEDDVTRREGRERVFAAVRSLVPGERPGEFNQALMELGSTVCTPSSPSCDVCPLRTLCRARAEGLERSLPRAAPAKSATEARVAFALVESKGRVLLVRRPESGLLGGLWCFPGGEPSAGLAPLVRLQTGLRVRIGEPISNVDHAFSHRRWKGRVYRGVATGGTLMAEARWAEPADLQDAPLVPFVRRILESRATAPGPRRRA